MQGFKEYLIEHQMLTWDDLNHVETYIDKFFHTLGLDVGFTKHFLERANDPRNKKQITMQELIRLFTLTYQKFGNKIKHMKPESEAVLKDMSTDINSPVVLKWNNRLKMLEIVAKTVMRKKNFLSRDPTLAVR